MTRHGGCGSSRLGRTWSWQTSRGARASRTTRCWSSSAQPGDPTRQLAPTSPSAQPLLPARRRLRSHLQMQQPHRRWAVRHGVPVCCDTHANAQVSLSLSAWKVTQRVTPWCLHSAGGRRQHLGPRCHDSRHWGRGRHGSVWGSGSSSQGAAGGGGHDHRRPHRKAPEAVVRGVGDGPGAAARRSEGVRARQVQSDTLILIGKFMTDPTPLQCRSAPSCAVGSVVMSHRGTRMYILPPVAGIQVMTQYKQTMAFIKPLYRDLARRRVPGDMLAGWVPAICHGVCVGLCMLRDHRWWRCRASSHTGLVHGPGCGWSWMPSATATTCTAMTSTCDLQLVGLIASSDVASPILSHMSGGLVVMVLTLCVLRCFFRSLSNSDVWVST